MARSRRGGLLVVLCTLGCVGEAPRPSDGAVADRAAAAAPDGHRHVLDVDWVRFSEADIHQAALAVVRGRVVEQWEGSHRTYPVDPVSGRELDPEEAGDRFAELPLLTSVVLVEERLDAREDSSPAIGNTVEVVQLGGRYPDGCWVEPSDQRLLRAGDQIAVFLKAAAMVPRERVWQARPWSIVGGQQGLVPLTHGLIDPIADSVFSRYAGRPVSELARDVQLLAPGGSR